MFRPTIELNRLTDIDINLLKKYNIKGLIIDVDNTLSTHKGEKLINGIFDWIELMESNNIKLFVLSNGKKDRLKEFMKKIPLEYNAMALKPLPFKLLKAVKKTGLKRKETAICGDQIFTDVFCGKLAGVKQILLNPILPETKRSFKIKRYFEQKLKKRWHKNENI